MITETLLFTIVRLRYTKNAVDLLAPDFQPDGKSAADVAAMLTAATTALGAGLALEGQRAAAHETFKAEWGNCHDACVDVFACMRSCYRYLPGPLGSIESTPKDDRTPGRTLARMKALSGVWAGLPNVPGTANPFAVRGITRAAFDASVTAFDTKWQSYTNYRSQVNGDIRVLREQNEQWEEFVSAAVTQGRANYPEGTAGRGFLDAIPSHPATQKPGQAVITSAINREVGLVELAFTAPSATSFQVWHKGPGAGLFTQVAEVLLPGEFQHTGLAAGAHQYQVVGANSRGTGPASATSTVEVEVAAVA